VRGVCVYVCVCVGAVKRVRVVVCLGFESRLNLGGVLCARQHASMRGRLKRETMYRAERKRGRNIATVGGAT